MEFLLKKGCMHYTGYCIVSAKEDFLVVLLMAGVALCLQKTLLNTAPRSFSLGESSLVSQGFILAFYTSHSFKTSASNETDFLQVFIFGV